MSTTLLAFGAFALSSPAYAQDREQPEGPVGLETPCQWILRLAERGATLDEQIAAAEAKRDLFTMADRKCLKQAGIHRRLLQATRESLGEAIAAAAEDSEARRQAALVGLYDVEVLGAVVGPTKAGGDRWDLGFGSALSGLTHAYLATLPQGLLLLEHASRGIEDLVTQVGNSSALPDVFGYLQISGPNTPTSWEHIKVSLRPPSSPLRDSIDVNFPGGPGFNAVQLEHGDGVRVTLYDSDIDQNDLVGTFEVNAEELLQAAELGRPVAINVSTRTNNTVLQLKIKVHAASQSEPSPRGRTFR